MVENTIEHLERSSELSDKHLGKIVLKVSDLRTQRLKGINFEVRKGELLGIAGLQGQGQSELLNAIFGSIHFYGVISIDGVDHQFAHTSESMRQDIALVPGDRAKEGLLMRSSIYENLMLPSWMKYGFPLNTRKAKSDAFSTSQSLKIVMANMYMPVSSLSGGNAQKVVIGKWLHRKPRILLLDDPTKGVDVGTKNEFYDLLRELCNTGTTILFYSSDDEELVGLCDRVLVIRDGRIRTELSEARLTLSNLITASVASYEEQEYATS